MHCSRPCASTIANHTKIDSEEQLKSFLEKVKTDTTLQEKLKAIVDADAVMAIAQEAGFAITSEDIQSIQSPTDLSDDELEEVARGKAAVCCNLQYVGRSWCRDTSNI